MTAVDVPANDLSRRAEAIGAKVAGPAADEVDRAARFPTEAFDALREDAFLSILIPSELGGAVPRSSRSATSSSSSGGTARRPP